MKTNKKLRRLGLLLVMAIFIGVFCSVNCFAADNAVITDELVSAAGANGADIELVPNMAALKLKNYDENELVKEVVKYIGVIIALVGIIAGVFFIAQGAYSQQPEHKKMGIEILVTCLVASALITILTNMILA